MHTDGSIFCRTCFAGGLPPAGKECRWVYLPPRLHVIYLATVAIVFASACLAACVHLQVRMSCSRQSRTCFPCRLSAGLCLCAVFNRAKLPERTVHARGFAAKGYFEVSCPLISAIYSGLLTIVNTPHALRPAALVHAMQVTKDITNLCSADLFSAVGKKTPVHARFSTVVHERGSPESLRDIRGFSVKFYTQEGNWDFVGNATPVSPC